MSYFVSKIGHLDPRFYSLIYCAIPGVQMSGVQMSDFISKIGHLDPRFYSLIYCDTGGPDVGGPDVGGPDVGGPDVGGPDVRFPFMGLNLPNFVRMQPIWVLSMFKWFGIIGPKLDQIWAWPRRGHRLAVGVHDPLKSLVIGNLLKFLCFKCSKFDIFKKL